MSVNVSVNEGNVSRAYSNVSKVRMQNPSGGTVDFIPEVDANEYADLGEGQFTKNGDYLAAASGFAGFSKVKVNVPQSGGAQADNMIQDLQTNITTYALTPKIRRTVNGWEWIDGSENKTFSGNSSTQKRRQYITVSGTEQKISYMPLVEPNDYTAIEESDTTFLTTFTGEQVYFKDLTALAAGGFTTLSPKTANPTMTNDVLDMHKCRRLKGSDAATDIVKTYGTITTQTVNDAEVLNFNLGVNMLGADVNYTQTATDKIFKTTLTDGLGRQWGFAVKMLGENNPVICVRHGNMDLQAFYGLVVDDLESQEAQALPAGTIALLRRSN